MFSRLRFRLVLSHLLVIILAMGLSGFLLLSFLEQYFAQATTNSLIAQAQITAQTLIPGALISEADILSQEPLTNTIVQQQRSNLSVQAIPSVQPSDRSSIQLSTQLDTRIRILDTAGVVRFDSWEEAVGQDLSEISPVRQALAGGYATDTQDGMLFLALSVEADGQPAGIVYLSQSLNDVIIVLRDLRWRWGLSTGVGLLLSAAVGLILSQLIVKPLQDLTAAVEAVTQGNLQQKVILKSRDELGRLSAAFNEMTAYLHSARQAQTDFVANVSHELRTPLTSVKTIVETLRAGAVNDLEVRDSFLETVENETDRLTRLVNDLLLLSRADSGALKLDRQTVNLAEFMQTIVKPLVMQSDHTISVDIPEALMVSIDRDRIAQVVINLLDNALKYSRPQSRVTICANASGPQVSIRDEGVGIAATDLPRIGQRFYRAEKARSRTHGGSGLGLAIAKVLVEAHGGRLWVESAEGLGTTVHFTLPAT